MDLTLQKPTMIAIAEEMAILQATQSTTVQESE